MTEETKIAGYTSTEWIEMLASEKAKSACKKLAYLDGECQLDEMVKYLNENRRKWQSRGFRPAYRNFTAMIVEQSCRLFNHAVPDLAVYAENAVEPDVALTEAVNEELSKVEFQELMINLDAVVRLLKTAFLLVQYDAEDKKLDFEILHRGNCAIVRDAKNRVTALIYRTSEDDTGSTFRIFTKEQITDLYKDVNAKDAIITNQEDNTYGMIPVAVFYDTKTPRSGVWIDGGGDLVNTNESLNIHITDNDWTSAFMKRPMGYTNADLEGDDDQGGELETYVPYGSPLPRSRHVGEGVLAGPDKMISLSTGNGEPLVVEYKSPVVQLDMLDEVMKNRLIAVAADWSVNMKPAGSATANSGFQLVVEEIQNLELRKQRQKMMSAGLKRLYRVIRNVLNSTGAFSIPEGFDLFAEFQEPALPVNHTEEVQVWQAKIDMGVANKVDFLVASEGMTREEAIAKLELIAEEDKALNPEPVQPVVDNTKPQM